MQPQWYIRRGVDQKGPLTAEQIKGLVQAGRLRANDEMCRTDQETWTPLSKVKAFDGMFSIKKAVAPGPPPMSSREQIESHLRAADDVRGIAVDKAKRGWLSFLTAARSAKSDAQDQAQKTKLERIDLASVYRKIGKEMEGKISHAAKCNEQIERLRDKIEKNDEATKAFDSQNAGSLARFGRKLKGQTTAAALQTKLQLAWYQLGKYAFEHVDHESLPPELLQQATEIHAAIQVINERVQSGNKSGPSGWSRPKTFALAGVGLLVFFFIAGLFFGNPSQLADSAKNADGSSVTSVEFPSEVLRYKTNSIDPVPKLRTTLAMKKSGTENSSGFSISGQTMFSPEGTFLVSLQKSDDPSPTVQLWNVNNDYFCSPVSAEADYFSVPMAFSPDETHLICIDGDYLNVWDVRGAEANLARRVLNKPSHQNGKWHRISWYTAGTALLESYEGRTTVAQEILDPINKAQIGQAKLSGDYWKTVPGFKGVSGESFRYSPDGKYLIVLRAAAYDGSVKGPGMELHVVDAKSYETIVKHSLPLGNGNEVQQSGAGGLLTVDVPIFSERSVLSKPQVHYSPDGRHAFINNVKSVNSRFAYQLDLTRLNASPARMPTLAISHYDRKSQRVVMRRLEESQTAKGTKRQFFVDVVDLASGKTVQAIDLGKPFEAATEKLDVRLLNQGKSVIVASLCGERWVGLRKIPNEYAIGRWVIGNPQPESVIQIPVTERPSFPVRSEVQFLHPNGEFLVNGQGEAWNVKHLETLFINLAEGDRDWNDKNYDSAFEKYAAVITDSEASRIGERLQSVWSRCIDCFAMNSNVASARQLIDRAREAGIAIFPKTPDGKQLLVVYNEELAEREKLERQAKREANEKALAEMRNENQSKFRPAYSFTKREFKEKLVKNMVHGRVDDSIVYAVFKNFAFQDIFGEPGSDVSYINLKRLYRYECSDGFVQLVVSINDSIVIVTEMNTY